MKTQTLQTWLQYSLSTPPHPPHPPTPPQRRRRGNRLRQVTWYAQGHTASGGGGGFPNSKSLISIFPRCLPRGPAACSYLCPGCQRRAPTAVFHLAGAPADGYPPHQGLAYQSHQVSGGSRRQLRPCRHPARRLFCHSGGSPSGVTTARPHKGKSSVCWALAPRVPGAVCDGGGTCFAVAVPALREPASAQPSSNYASANDRLGVLGRKRAALAD